MEGPSGGPDRRRTRPAQCAGRRDTSRAVPWNHRGMTGPVPGGRRRVDRVLDPAFVAGLAGLPLAEVRRRREEADLEEADLSYLRRLLHGRLDLLRGEQRRRAEGRTGDGGASAASAAAATPPRPPAADTPADAPADAAADADADAALRAFVERLALDLTADEDAPAPRDATGLGRHLRAEPTRVGERRRAPEVAWSDPVLADPAGVDDEGLAAALDRLVRLEAEVSEVRHAVQGVADVLAGEVGRRYRDGEAHVEDLLRPVGPDAG